jgi:hypothetical protein
VPTITNPNWYDLNADRAYPFLDTASRQATGSGFIIPDDLIVDLKLSAPTSLDPTRFFVSQLQAFGTGLLIYIAVDGVGDVALAAIPLLAGPEYQAFRVAPLPGQAVSGTIVIGGAGAVVGAGLTTEAFAFAATPLIPTIVLPSQGGVTSLTLRDSAGVEVRLTGDVVLTEGDNATITITGQTVEVGMASGVVIDPCGCPDPAGTGRPVIRTINGVGPDGNGDITIDVDGCPELTPATNGLRLIDRCAQPCCGDAEIAALVNSIQDIDRFLADLAGRASRLENGVRNVEAWLVQ